MQPAPELQALIGRYYAASAEGDTAFLGQLIARQAGALVIGADATEWWRGGDLIVETWSAAWRERGGPPVQDSQPQAFRSGDVGWVDDRASWRLPDGQLIPFRLTAAFHWDNTQWRLIQAHFSLGMSNE
jgi:hypothetical protein